MYDTPWRLRLLSFRIWVETLNQDTGEITLDLAKCPRELRAASTINQQAFTLAKIAAVSVSAEDWQ